MLHQKEDTGTINSTQRIVCQSSEDENEMSKILHIVHRIIWLIFFISIACNIAFICVNIHNNRQSGSASERIENELSGAASSITSASGTVKDISTINKQASDTAKQLSGTITDSTERCRDIEQTIRELRKEIGVLEKDCNNNVNSGSSD